MNGSVKQDSVPGNGFFFHTVDLKKSLQCQGASALTPPGALPCLFLWKKALKHNKECFVSGCLKVPGNGGFIP